MGKNDPILIVDDDAAIREAMVDFLELEGFSLRVAKNGREALDLLRDGLRPRLILLDLMMPVMTGWDFARELVADPALPRLPICVMTAARTSKPVAGEVVAVIPKPLPLERLLEVIRRYAASPSREG